MKYYYPQERVAVVAVGCILPDAMNTNALWKNILEKRVSIKEIPDRYFNKSVFYRPEVKGKTSKQDKSYTKIAAMIDEFDFMSLGRKYRIPPAVAAYMDNNQKAAIYCVDQAVENLKSSLPKERTAVILCNACPGEKFENVVRRTFFANVESHILNHPDISKERLPKIQEILKDVSRDVLKDTLPIIEDTSPGYLQNVIAGRISNILDLWGPSYVIDTACASSLTAIAASVSGLLNHEFDAAITGGVEVTVSEIGLVSFSGINALSPDGIYPFDSRANGFVMGLGGGAIVLKRLSDALRDGDHIYSIISGYGQGSDGKGKYIAAPSEEGQVRVIKRACQMAGYPVDTIEMIEAHGTGTIVGDVVEVSALKKAFAELGAQKENFCGVGSIKSNIGHLKNAAGIAGFIKATLALQNKILPATANIVEINPKLQLEGSPFYILQDNIKWMENSQHPRRANVSSYGFGGADYHICLEEFRPEFLRKSYSLSINKCRNDGNNILDYKENFTNKEEAVLFSGDSIEDLIGSYQSFVKNCEESQDTFEKAVYINNISASCKHNWRVSICAGSLHQLKDKWKMVEHYIREDRLNEANKLNLKGIYAGNGPEVTSSQIALMFPGQGSQYPNMLKGLYETYPCVKAFYMNADAIWKSKYNSSIMPLIFGDDEKLKDTLKNTKNTHPAMFISNIGVYKLLCEAGIKADFMIGHSLGEITSLFAGEMIDLKSAVSIIGHRGYSFDSIDEDQRGSMLSIKEKADKVEEIIKSSGLGVMIANINSMEQTVVGGDKKEIERFSEYLNQNGYKNTILNVSHAFHTDVVSRAAESFYESIKDIRFSSPKFKIMACHLSEFYNDLMIGNDNVADVLKEQILSPVRFADSVLKLYERGVRVFIESGPSNVLTNIVKSILSDKEVKVINVNNRSKCPVECFKQALAMLFAGGVEINYVPSNTVLGLQKENVSTVVYKVDQKDTPCENISCTVKKAEESLKNIGESFENTRESLLYTGVSMGLSGTFKKAFTDDNFQYILDGRNMIEMLTDEEAESILDLNITRLIKNEKETVFKRISSINEVIHFVGKFGKIDMVNDYLIDEKFLNQMTQNVCAGVAAGYEALKDAGIPLIRELKKASSGNLLPGRLVLPEEMQDETGIIFASGLSPIEAVISEVSKYTAAKFSSSTRKDILKFFEGVISKVNDYDSKKILTDWFALHYSRLSNNLTESDVYEFNYNLLTQLTSKANNMLAQFIGAKGPNMHISSACSTTASAVTVAEDLIYAGHANRMIVIGADITNGRNMLPWVGGAFSSVGALTEADNLYDAAIPFDKRRSGMILGSGAVGLIIEKDSDVAKRGMNGICRILGTHMFNSGGHQSRIDTNKHCIELDKFISKMEKMHNFSRHAIASKMVYCSHETYSHRQGGCSNMEKEALESAFGDKFREIKVINTKGMTGHTLGASIEEAVSAKVLQYQKIPPVVNYKEPDPDLEGLNLSKGGDYEVEYVLRTVSAFGGNGNYHLLQRVARGDERIVDKKAYQEWIERISSKDACLKNYGRLLVAETMLCDESMEKDNVEVAKSQSESNAQDITAKKIEVKPAMMESANDCEDEVLKIVSEITLYPVELLDKEMEMEADLGIDTVKQATIFSILKDRFEITEENTENLSMYKTIGALIEFVREKGKKAANIDAEDATQLPKTKDLQDVDIVRENDDSKKPRDFNDNDVGAEVLKLISEVTQYPVEMLEDDMELEADLGIDTIKQATIFSELVRKFNIDGNVKISQSELKNIRSIIDMVKINVLKEFESSLQPAESKYDGDNDNDITNDSDYTQVETKDVADNKDVAENDDQLELCVQYPIAVSENIGAKDYDLKDKSILVIGDNSKAVGDVCQYFKKISSDVGEFVFEKCISSEELEERIINCKDIINKTDVIIDCGHLGETYEFQKLTYESEKEILQLNGLTRFIFYKKLSQIRPDPALRIICTVFADGCFGFSSDENLKLNPYYGALCGFYKGLRKEFGKSKVKIVDLCEKNSLNLDEDVLEKIHDELEESSSLYEVGYVDDKRVTLKLDNVDRKDMTAVEKFDSNHFVITGGGNGITAGIVHEISRRFKVKLTIVGRTVLPPNIEELSKLDESSLEQKKNEIYDKLKREGKKATPVEVQNEYNKLNKAISVYKLLNDIRKNGCDVRYYSCDVRNHEGLKEVLNAAVANFGPVNVVIHGAGIEKSRLIGQKTKEEFEEVFEVKANGLCNLYRLVDKEHLKVLIAFSSISGRFGNEAQLDYCSANNFLSSFMSMIKSQNKKIRAVSISWSGWKDMGMAWRNEFVKENAEEMGLHLIEPERGVNEFINILSSNINIDEIVISKGLSYFVGLKKWHGIKNETPLIDWVGKKDGEIKRIYKVLSVKADPIINHHRVGKTPLMPAVGFMEMGAQAHSLLFGKNGQYCFKNLKFNNALKLFNEKPQEVVLKPVKYSDGFIKATFYNYFKPKIGEGRLIELNSMDVSPMIGDYEYLNKLKEIETADMVEIPFKYSLEQLSKRLPNAINLGPLFMDEKAAKINMFKYNDRGVVLLIALSEEQINNKKYNIDNMLINPAFADSIMQCCGIHSSYNTDGLYLPWQVDEFGIVNPPKKSGKYKAYAKKIGGNDSEKSYDVILYDEKGEVCYYAKKVTVKKIAQ